MTIIDHPDIDDVETAVQEGRALRPGRAGVSLHPQESR